MDRCLLSEQDRKIHLKDFLQSNRVSLDLFPYEWLCTTDFFRAPASTGFHAAYPGGLYDHSFNVTKCLLEFRDKGITVPWQRFESLFIVGLLHDVTKIGLYQPLHLGDENEHTYTHSLAYSTFGGHGYDSVCKIEQHTQLTEEEWYCIRYHMGAYETTAWEDYDRAIKRFPNVLWTHTADMLASKLMEG